MCRLLFFRGGSNKVNAAVNEHSREFARDAAWQVLTASADGREFAAAWLALQCEMIEEVQAGWLFQPGAGGQVHLIARREEGAGSAALAPVAGQLAREALDQKSGLIEELDQSSGYLLALPIADGQATRAVVAVSVGALPHARVQAVMRQLQWGGGWMLNRASRAESTPGVRDAESASDVFKLFAAAVEPEHFKASAAALTTRLAHLWQIERASVGMVRGKRVRIAAISHVAHTDARMDAVRRLEEAMHEAVDQASTIVLPQAGTDPGLVTHAAQSLLGAGAAGRALVVVPLIVRERAIGALLLENAKPFAPDEVRRIDALAALCAPILLEKSLNDRWLVSKVGSAVREQLGKLLGPAHPVRKLVAASVLLVTVGASLIDWPYHVLAPVVVEAGARRVVPAPFDGYLASGHVRPGDKVTAGQPLAQLDDSDLRLERLGLTADREQRTSELRAATAKYELAKANMLRAELDQIEAKLRLVEARLERAKVRAPIDGIVLSGDLSQTIGEPVKVGATLFELAPAGDFRLIINVDEFDVGNVAVGQTARAVLAALPEKTLNLTLTRVAPVLEAQGGRNSYRVEAGLQDPEPALRPGLVGRARIDAGERRVIWIWTHSFLTWLRLQLWAWIP